MSEEWKSVEGFEGLYEVSNYGNVKSLDRLEKVGNSMRIRHGRILKARAQKGGHLLVVLCKNGEIYHRTIHRLVASAFIDNPDNKPVVDHIDTNPANNCVSNLKWATVQENCMNSLTRIHNSESKKGHKCYLKHHSEGTKQKIREQRLGKKLSEEHRKRLSESHKGIGLGKSNLYLKGKHWKLEGGKRVWY